MKLFPTNLRKGTPKKVFEEAFHSCRESPSLLPSSHDKENREVGFWLDILCRNKGRARSQILGFYDKQGKAPLPFDFHESPKQE